MKKYLFIMLGVFSNQTIQANQLEFSIEGLKSAEGKVYVQLFQGKDNYQQHRAAESRILNAQPGQLMLSFHNLPEGEYAVRLFHDENNNGQLETNLLGMPIEGYGFSNDAKPDYGPVVWKQVMFPVNQSKTVNRTTVIY